MITKPRREGVFVVKTSLFEKFNNETINKENIRRIYADAAKFERNIEIVKKGKIQ